ncbi:MAG: hypothetical protein RTU30_11185 [Candidatus Thorarchaeota archaeon]
MSPRRRHPFPRKLHAIFDAAQEFAVTIEYDLSNNDLLLNVKL